MSSDNAAELLKRVPENAFNRVTQKPYKNRLPGTALCLSGGGYRAMVFHVGALRRLNEVGYLGHIDLVSSVSGGSITAAALALQWPHLGFSDGRAASFGEFEKQVFSFAGRSVDAKAIIGGIALPWRSIGSGVARSYRKHFFQKKTLQDLPEPGAEAPQFTFNATSLQTGALVRANREKVADYRVGEILEPRLELAEVVAASSAFPPVLSPKAIKLDEAAFTKLNIDELRKLLVSLDPDTAPPTDPAEVRRAVRAFLTRLYLSDGGVYDNMGLERARRYHTILVSDGGGPYKIKRSLRFDWLSQSKRAWLTTDRQVRALRRRWLIQQFIEHERLGTYWGIEARMAEYEKDGLTDPLPCDPPVTDRLARIPTRLSPIDEADRYRLINWGYAVCDAALRTYVDTTLLAPQGFPYPDHPLG